MRRSVLLLFLFAALVLSSACSISRVSSSLSPTPETSPTATETPTPKPTATLLPMSPSSEVTHITPDEAYLAASTTVTFTVTGTYLDGVEEAQFVAEDADPIPLKITDSSTNTLILALDLSSGVPVEGEMNYTLQLEGEPSEVVALRDFWEQRTVQGVQESHVCLDRIQQEEDGTIFAWLLENSSDGAELNVRIQSGDKLHILAEQDGRYQSRVAQSHNPARVGNIGWAETWLVDGEGMPKCPTSTPEPVPTSTPAHQPPTPTRSLVQIPHMPGADVGQARQHLQSLGFSVSVHELPRDQDHSLCNGWISYTSPPERTYVDYGSHVQIFYRSFNQENPPGC